MWKKRRREYMMKSAVSTEVNVKKSMNLMLDVKKKKYEFSIRCFVLEMKILIYWSESNSLIYFFRYF